MSGARTLPYSTPQTMSFEPFSALHVAMVAALASAIAALCMAGRSLSETPRRRLELVMAAAVAALWIGYQAYDSATRGFGWGHSLPLQLCDLAALIAVAEFGRPSRSVNALAWFWGVALSMQAVVTPDLAVGPGEIAFWAFWTYHFFIVGSGVYAVAVRGFRPEWPDLRLAIALGVVYAVAMFTINAAFGLNYGYFGRSEPGQPSLIDFLGPWPLRALWMVLLAAAVMTLFWLPWRSRGRIRSASRHKT